MAAEEGDSFFFGVTSGLGLEGEEGLQVEYGWEEAGMPALESSSHEGMSFLPPLLTVSCCHSLWVALWVAAG